MTSLEEEEIKTTWKRVVLNFFTEGKRNDIFENISTPFEFTGWVKNEEKN